MKQLKKIFVVFVLLVCCHNCLAQMNLSEQNRFLDEVIKDMSDSSSVAVPILEQQVVIKGEVIKQLKDSIVQIDKDIFNHEVYYERLNSQLDYEKNIYADLIVKAHRLRSLMYENFDIFSFDNLYTTYRQFLYIKWLTDYRKKKIVRINSLKHEIEKVVAELEAKKTDKSEKAKLQGVEEEFLRKYNSRKSALLKHLSHNAVAENSDIHTNNLDSIRNVSSLMLSKESDDDASTLFKLQEGYLMWPVHKAVIINYFGEKKHPLWDDVKIKNDGLDFCVPSSSKVQCVYNGEVVKITLLPRNQYVVIVKHGSYYTVYNGLDYIKVTVGDVMERGEVIGSFDDEHSHANFNFQIWKGAEESLDPYKWLIKYPKK
ncbi:MAG: peptidoglycan DD-metalloendopeptidase family protein [Bacteroidales bacterium]|nr:peptidoglycan DD-metalloendopeptidase family protein [Bacteroidales bacterium]